jgi:hypothetical protein
MSNNKIPIIQYIPVVSTVISMFQDLFEKTEKEKILKQIKTYNKWYSRYIVYKSGGKKRKNMLDKEAYDLLVNPLRIRLIKIEENEIKNKNT